MERNRFLVYVDFMALAFFSIVLALGTWNPFSPYSFDEEDGSNILSQILIIAFVIYLVVSSIFRASKIKVNTANKLLIVFGIILSLISLFNVTNGGFKSSMMTVIKFGIEIVLLIYLSNLFVEHPKYISYSLLFFAISCTVISVLYFFGYLNSFVTNRSGRIYFFGENPNSTSSRIVAAVLAMFYLLVQNPLGWNKGRYLLFLLFIPLFSMVFVSGSRGSIIILGACIVVYILFSGLKRKTKVTILLGLGALALVYFSSSYFQRVSEELAVIERFTQMAEGDDGGRALLNKMTKQIILDRPLFGYGISGYMDEMYRRYGETHVVHNLYYYVFAVSGVFGAIPFFLFLFICMKNAYRIRKRQVLPLVFMVYILLLVAKTGGVLTYALVWYLFAIISAQISLYSDPIYNYAELS